MDFGLQGPEKLSRVSTDDGDVYDLDNEDEFLPPAATAPGFDVDHVRRQFDQDIDEAQKFLVQNLDEADRKRQWAQFVHARASEWDKTTWEGQNFLHYLAYDHNSKPSVSLQWLMSRAILKLPRLMGIMDKSSRTPLTAALYIGNERFSHAACINVGSKTREQIKPELMSECKSHDNDREVTCLHTALTSEFSTEEHREKICRAICSFVPEEMFSITDHRGRTPLHLAVEYGRCCKTQVNIVKELLRRGPQALYVDILNYNRTYYSVYQYHESSRRAAQSQFDQRPARELRDDKLKLSDSKSDAKKAVTKPQTGEMVSSLPRDMAGLFGSIKRGDSIAPISRDREGHKLHLNTQLKPSSVQESLTNSTHNTLNAALQKEEERAQAAKLISEELKLLYLRTQRPDRAARCLRIQDEQGT